MTRTRNLTRGLPWLALLLALLPAGARGETRVYLPEGCAAGPAARSDDELLRCFAPAFVAPEAEEPHNRIGTPEIVERRWRRDHARVAPDRAAAFAEVRRDRVGGRDVVQLVYRIHFERIPFALSWHFFEMHRNPGLLVVETLDASDLTPLFVTTVHTCGCYRAVLPTDRLPADALPVDWPAGEIAVYGQTLPSRLPAPDGHSRRVFVHLNPHNHRVTHLETRATPPAGELAPLPLRSLADLRALPVVGGRDGQQSSFFYRSGPLRGHVRGAWNPFEGLTIFGLVALDPTVGMDKAFGDPEQTGTPFYTMLRFWKHDASRLDRFESLLRELDFRPDALGHGAAE